MEEAIENQKKYCDDHKRNDTSQKNMEEQKHAFSRIEPRFLHMP